MRLLLSAALCLSSTFLFVPSTARVASFSLFGSGSVSEEKKAATAATSSSASSPSSSSCSVPQGTVGWVDTKRGPTADEEDNKHDTNCPYFYVPVQLDGQAAAPFSVTPHESIDTAVNLYCSQFSSADCHSSLLQHWRTQHADFMRSYDKTHCESPAECVDYHFKLATTFAAKGFHEEASQHLLHVYTTKGPETMPFSVDMMLGNNLLFSDRLDQAMTAWDLAFGKAAQTFTEKLPDQITIVEHPYQQGIRAPNTTRFRMKHDLAQFHHLAAQGVFTMNFAQLITARYNQVFQELGGETNYERDAQLPLTLSDSQWSVVAPFYNRAIYKYPLPRVSSSVLPSVLNPNIDWQQVEQVYFSSVPHVVVIDNLFHPSVAHELQQFAERSTIWNVIKERGFMASYIDFGLGSPLLGQIAEEMKIAAPRIFCHLMKLQQAWAEKYDDLVPSGISVNSDTAAVNVNFWVTPDSASPAEGPLGGLLIYKVKPADSVSATELSLKQIDYANITVPYRFNRAVLYESEYLHGSGAFRVRPGYENRRVSFSLLFGKQGEACPAPPPPAAPAAATDANANVAGA